MEMETSQGAKSAQLPEVRLAPMKLQDTLRDVVIDEFSVAVLQCQIISNQPTDIFWYKDGELLTTSQRIKLLKSNYWHQLEISPVSMSDSGIYTIICTDGRTRLHSKCALYVKNIRNIHLNDSVFYFAQCPEEIVVLRHIRDISIFKGERIRLELLLKKGIVDEYEWYKSNCGVYNDKRTLIMSGDDYSTLSIPCAVETDSGLYHVAAKNEQSIVSSFAKVIVTDAIDNRDHIPVIVEPFPDEIESNESEELRIMCRIRVDSETMLSCEKNRFEIDNDGKIRQEDYGNGYVGMTFLNPDFQDTADYTIAVRHALTGRSDSTSCRVNFIESEPLTSNKPKLVPTLLKPLDTVVACFGSQVALKCSFDLKDTEFFYVVWHIGRYRVERTNHRFNVVCSNGEFYLIIKRLVPEMAGVICCELRRYQPSRKSIFVTRTITNLFIVPPTYFMKLIRLQARLGRKVCFRTCSEIAKKSYLMYNYNIPAGPCNSRQVEPLLEALEVDFCRLEEDGHCFLEVTKRSSNINCDSLSVHKKHGESTSALEQMHQGVDQLIVIQWAMLQPHYWFAIDCLQSNGSFDEAGLTSVPRIEVENPPLERVLKLRIRAVTPVDAFSQSTVRITPPRNDAPRSYKICELKDIKDFRKSFRQTGDKIGSGAFGSVFVLEQNNGHYFAAKLLRTRVDKRRETAMREFEMLRQLKHPSLWGGELFERVIDEEHIKEVDVIPYVRQICEALQYIHSKRMVHLDIKPENIICMNPNSRQIKLIDFGLARILEENHVTKAIYGTRDYIAPEVLNYDVLTLTCDMWSLGVVTYVLLSGVTPFTGNTWPELSANITRATYNYDETAFKDVSDVAKNFVDSLLVLEPYGRMSATEALRHKWIVEGPPKGADAAHMTRARQNLKTYLADYRGRWHRAGKVMIAANRLRNQVDEKDGASSAESTDQVT
ncbi:unnamed protein product, partial [Iphiclides podalirius]